ncbi:hypothetical protein MRS44_013979 [Fusarium solani]|uniref:uncharacterized protein n=1 Tax=Fusarium solani TaxID=169388 RepID=UPI0032C40C0D|nr:hypothetical protein MRS44_013979 [Fusarium solani]
MRLEEHLHLTFGQRIGFSHIIDHRKNLAEYLKVLPMRARLRALGKLLHLSSTAEVQVLSDLHLEVAQQYLSYTFPATAPLLLLGGDIGRLADYDGYLKFLERQVCRYKKVFLVLGNHEFYGLDYETGLKTSRRLEAEPTIAGKLLVLHRARWDDPDSALTILGCTLWSAIPKEAYSVVQSKVNDFKKINKWSVEGHNEIHAQEAAWLRKEVAQVPSQKRQLLVATHHAPSVHGTSRPGHTENPWTCAFATDLAGQDGWNRVNVWFFGHTHYSTDLMCNGVRLVANQRGYVLPGAATLSEENKKEKDAHSFDVTKIVMREILFCHPGYPEVGGCSDFNILLSLNVFDDGCKGDCGTALTECAILANSQWDGYFSLGQHGVCKVDPLADGILRGERYYFCLSDDPANDRYPVIPRFSDWRFPHGNLPSLWERLREQLRANRTGRNRNTNCALSNYGDAVETAHLVPSKQEYWFRANLMKRMFDERHYTFVPKPTIPREHLDPAVLPGGSHMDSNNGEQRDETGIHHTTAGLSQDDLPLRPGSGTATKNLAGLYVVAHVFNSTPSGDLPRLLQNRLLCLPPPSTSVDFLFARFACTIFAPSVFKYFLDSNQERTLLVWNQEELKHDIEEASSETCHRI